MEDKIVLKFKTKNILNFYEIEPWTHTNEKPYLINLYFFKIGKAKKKVNRMNKIRVCMYVSEICAEGIFVNFPWWLKNVKSRSKIALF